MSVLLKQLGLTLVIAVVILAGFLLLNYLFFANELSWLSGGGSNSPFTSPYTLILLVIAGIWGVIAKWRSKSAEERLAKSIHNSVKNKRKSKERS